MTCYSKGTTFLYVSTHGSHALAFLHRVSSKAIAVRKEETSIFRISKRSKATEEKYEGVEGETEGGVEVADLGVLHPPPSEPTPHSLPSIPSLVYFLDLACCPFSSVSYNRQKTTNSFQVHCHEPNCGFCQCSLILFDTSPWDIKPLSLEPITGLLPGGLSSVLLDAGQGLSSPAIVYLQQSPTTMGTLL